MDDDTVITSFRVLRAWLNFCVNEELIAASPMRKVKAPILPKEILPAFAPEDLRRTFVSDLLDAGADIVTLAKMAGHASVQTTARYDWRPEDAKCKAADLLHVPYRQRGLGG